ncbi:MAG: GH116 family glycosyl hydrolase [Thermoguttaceae bacterium]
MILAITTASAASAAEPPLERYRSQQDRRYNGAYEGAYLDHFAFPMGGIGAGMVCLEGSGCLAQVSVRHKPEIFKEPMAFAAVYVKSADRQIARVLEGAVPTYKVLRTRGADFNGSGNGAGGTTYGLPRFRTTSMLARFPFATLTMTDPAVPLRVDLTGWSPFTPPRADDSSLPVAALEYGLTNSSKEPVEGVFSFHSENFMAQQRKPGGEIREIPGGFMLYQAALENEPWQEGAFCVSCDDPAVKVDCAWFRGGWFDPLTMIWKAVSKGEAISRGPHKEGAPSNGASLYLPFRLGPGQSKNVRLLLTWYVPASDIRAGAHAEVADAAAKKPEECCPGGTCCPAAPEPKQYVPWYARRFAGVDQVRDYWKANVDRLRDESAAFRDCFFDTTLPPEVVEAVAANLSILKSPTCLRQHDGKFWGWEGCHDTSGCCAGSCSHVWNYAQALPHLFPGLERTMREATLLKCQDEQGHQTFRTPLPVGPAKHDFHAAADGQLGNVMRVYREWRISGDTAWMVGVWPQVKQSLEYSIGAWDPDRQGTLREPHHNTYDIEFWGPDGMCTTMYLGALEAAVQMGKTAGDDVSAYEELAAASRKALEEDLFNGEYFIQKIQLQGLRASDPTNMKGINMNYSPEAVELLKEEGPKYQYGSGCLSDGVLGAWIAEVCGLGVIVDEPKLRSHLSAVHRYNFLADLSGYANPQRPAYALNHEGGLLLCSWPKGGELSLPFVYSNEVWTGIEYQVASHLMLVGQVDEALDIVRACRDRYDGRVRNPFCEIECGHYYARAMASYGLLQGLTGARYDAVEKVLYLDPAIEGDFRAFLSTASGFGTVGIHQGKPFVEMKSGALEVKQVVR